MAEKVTATELREAQEQLVQARHRREQAFVSAIDEGRSYRWVAAYARVHATTVHQIVKRMRRCER